MIKATSIQVRIYEESFRKAFVHQNADDMIAGQFKIENESIYGITKRGEKSNDIIGDIGGYYVSSRQTPLRHLLPLELRMADRDFVIKKGSKVFFELRDDLWEETSAYIRNKVQFHHKIISGEAYNWRVEPEKHVLIFCFNGLDSVEVSRVFRDACREYGIYGTSVYISSQVVIQWDLILTLAEKDRKIATLKRRISLLAEEEAHLKKNFEEEEAPPPLKKKKKTKQHKKEAAPPGEQSKLRTKLGEH